ncbi:hypothetical protein MM239_14535 [Belliella sp. DSM 111904]|uniref:Uncharacterized protein n=1 Tax=Belliella filtrata TaxID=2923435 RepID=A0ABS9V2H2_9BACT|nr:hypothetical protein [Belliella filtrata]MCH7410622.1 hypothetical protein [Belliella filtrata]
MRKVIAIFLLCVFSLYHFGYYGFYYSFNRSLEAHWGDKIFDTNVENEAILEVPISVPYMADQADFQATNTKFEKDGKYYRAIKQRYQNDTLQIVYVPDTAKQKLDTVVKQWVTSLITDEVPAENGNSTLSKLFVKDFTQPEYAYTFSAGLDDITILIGYIFSTDYQIYISNITPPPELA